MPSLQLRRPEEETTSCTCYIFLSLSLPLAFLFPPGDRRSASESSTIYHNVRIDSVRRRILFDPVNMLSNSLVRSAFGASRSRVGGLSSRVRVSASLTAPTQNQWQEFNCRHSVESKRWISVYGYTQAKALVYSRYGEPKDVLQ